MKKFVLNIFLLLICSLGAKAENYVFDFDTDGGGNDQFSWTITYDSATKKLSASRTLYEIMGLLPIPKEKVIISADEPASVMLSSKGFNYGGNENEILFLNNRGVVILGLYINPEEFGKTQRHKGYVIHQSPKGLQTQSTYLIRNSVYEDYRKLQKAMSGSSASKSTSSNQGTSKSATQSSTTRKTVDKPKEEPVRYYGSMTESVLKNRTFLLSDAIFNVMGNIKYSSVVNKPWSTVFQTLKSTFGIEPMCRSNFFTFKYYCQNCLLLGMPLERIEIWSNEQSYFNWEFTWYFTKKKDADLFLKTLVKEIDTYRFKQQSAYKKTYFTWILPDSFGGRRAYLSATYSKVSRKCHVVSLETSIHLSD